MAKKTRKQKRKELLSEEDAFINAASDSAKWMADNKGLVIVAVIALFGVIAGTFAWRYASKTSNNEASGLYQAALDVMDAEIIEPQAPVLDPDGGEEPAEVANPEGDPPTFASEEDRSKAALAAFERVVKDASGSEVATLALFYVGNLQAKLGDTDAAIATFEGLQKSLHVRDSLYFLAAERLAYLKESKGDREGAASALRPIQGQPGNFFTDYAIYHQARFHLENGEKDLARALLENLEKNHPDSSLKSEVEGRLDMIGRTAESSQVAEAPTDKATEATP